MIFSIRPAYYVGQLVYFELNIDSIIQKYCVNKDKPEFQCNGKCHLAKQLIETSNNDTNSNNNSLLVLFESFIPVYINTFKEIEFKNPNALIVKKEIFRYRNTYSFLREFKNLKPPIF